MNWCDTHTGERGGEWMMDKVNKSGELTEIEYLEVLESKLALVFDYAVAARNDAQAALEMANIIKGAIIQRRVELLRATTTNR
jgi:hypothetical protein